MDDGKLELRLGPPGSEEDHHYSTPNSLLYFGHSSSGLKRCFFETVELKNEGFKTKGEVGEEHKQGYEKNASAVVQNTRITAAPVVGWPPIRNFRKNLATNSSKPTPESKNESLEKVAKTETKNKGLFVKINMDGIPIGRKVDLKAYDSYEKLSLAANELFRGLLAAQRDPAAAGTPRHPEKEQAITGLLDGSGEYTLVYEDDEGDRMLVGDVPWNMFVSTAKRLRVLKSSEISTLSLGSINRKGKGVVCC